MNGLDLMGIEMEVILLDSNFLNLKVNRYKVNMVVVLNLMFLVDYFDLII